MRTKPARRIVIDPVCEMDVVAMTAPGISYSGRRIYYFCSMPCKQAFDQDPEHYIQRIARAAVEARHRNDEGRTKGRRVVRRRIAERHIISV